MKRAFCSPLCALTCFSEYRRSRAAWRGAAMRRGRRANRLCPTQSAGFASIRALANSQRFLVRVLRSKLDCSLTTAFGSQSRANWIRCCCMEQSAKQGKSSAQLTGLLSFLNFRSNLRPQLCGFGCHVSDQRTQRSDIRGRFNERQCRRKSSANNKLEHSSDCRRNSHRGLCERQASFRFCVEQRNSRRCFSGGL